MSDRPEKRKIEFIESYWTGGELGSDYQWNDNHGELVRCRDCKHGEKLPIFQSYPNNTWCNQHTGLHNDNWFCADGER